jgi:hypothetical protein
MMHAIKIKSYQINFYLAEKTLYLQYKGQSDNMIKEIVAFSFVNRIKPSVVLWMKIKIRIVWDAETM